MQYQWLSGRLNYMWMPCRRAQGLLEAYAHGDLPAAAENAVAAHLNRCATCQAEYETMFTIRCVLDTYPRIEVAPNFNQQVWNRVATRRPPAPSRLDCIDNFFARPLYKLAGSTTLGLALAALLVGAVLLPGFLHRDTTSLQTSHTSPAAALVPSGGDRMDASITALNHLPSAGMTGSYADWMRALQQPGPH